jgi:hypothetical protein
VVAAVAAVAQHQLRARLPRPARLASDVVGGPGRRPRTRPATEPTSGGHPKVVVGEGSGGISQVKWRRVSRETWL